jgi:hypothetical protein
VPFLLFEKNPLCGVAFEDTAKTQNGDEAQGSLESGDD